MEAIVCILIITQFAAIAVFAVGWYSQKCLYDEMLKLYRKPPQVNLDPMRAEVKEVKDGLVEHAKQLETLRSAIVLKSAFK